MQKMAWQKQSSSLFKAEYSEIPAMLRCVQQRMKLSCLMLKAFTIDATSACWHRGTALQDPGRALGLCLQLLGLLSDQLAGS